MDRAADRGKDSWRLRHDDDMADPAALGASLALAWRQARRRRRKAPTGSPRMTDWSVFEESDPKRMLGVSSPKETRQHTRRPRGGGAARRYPVVRVLRPAERGRPGVVHRRLSLRRRLDRVAGYRRHGVRALYRGRDGPGRPSEEDTKIIAAMKRGAEAVLTGVSGRGTLTTGHVLAARVHRDRRGRRKALRRLIGLILRRPCGPRFSGCAPDGRAVPPAGIFPNQRSPGAGNDGRRGVYGRIEAVRTRR